VARFARPLREGGRGGGLRAPRASLFVRAIVTVLLVGARAFYAAPAAAETRTTIAIFVDGPGAAAVRQAVLKAIPQEIDVADPSRFRAELARAGQTKGFGEFNKTAIFRLRRAASAVGAEAVVVLRVRDDKKSRLVRLLVVDLVAEVPPPISVRLGPKPIDNDSRDLAALLGHSLDVYAPPPAPPPEEAGAPEGDGEKEANKDEPTPDVPPPPVAVVAPVTPSVGAPPEPAPAVPPPPRRTAAQLAARSTIDVALGAEAAGRHYEYDNGIARAPYVFRLPAKPAVIARATLFPLAWTKSILGDLGVAFTYGRVSLEKADVDGPLKVAPPTAYSVGLRARIHPGLAAGTPRIILGIEVGYAFSAFSVVGPPNAELPPVTYRALRPALDVRLPLGNFSLLGAAAARVLLDPNGVSLGFGEASGIGFDGELGVALMFVRHVEARLAARYERYSISLKPPSGATFGAGSATDERYSGGLSLAVLF